MSRIGKKARDNPGRRDRPVNGQEVAMKGPKGELKHVLVDAIVAKLDNGEHRGRHARGHQGSARHVGHVAHAWSPISSPA